MTCKPPFLADRRLRSIFNRLGFDVGGLNSQFLIAFATIACAASISEPSLASAPRKATPTALAPFGGRRAGWSVVSDDRSPAEAAEFAGDTALKVIAAEDSLRPMAAQAVLSVGVTDGPSLGGGYFHLLGRAGPTGAGADALTCLTQAVYFEARSEPVEGQEAVAQVVMNRTRMPQYPREVCDVVFQGADRPTGCQFSFTCNGVLGQPTEPEAWTRAQQVAQHALSGFIYLPLKDATHFHAAWVNPYWSGSLTRLGQIGGHIFYH